MQKFFLCVCVFWKLHFEIPYLLKENIQDEAVLAPVHSDKDHLSCFVSFHSFWSRQTKKYSKYFLATGIKTFIWQTIILSESSSLYAAVQG